MTYLYKLLLVTVCVVLNITIVKYRHRRDKNTINQTLY